MELECFCLAQRYHATLPETLTYWWFLMRQRYRMNGLCRYGRAVEKKLRPSLGLLLM